jgi:hypothetical protein
MNYSALVANLLLLADEEYGETQTKIILEAATVLENLGQLKYAGLRDGKIVEFAKDKLALNYDHIDEIVEIVLDNPTDW